MRVETVRTNDGGVVGAMESSVVGEGVDFDARTRVGHLLEDGLGDECVEHGAKGVALAGAHGVEHLDWVPNARVLEQDDAGDAVHHPDVGAELRELLVDELPDRVAVEVLKGLACIARNEKHVWVCVQGVAHSAEEHFAALLDADRVLADAVVALEEELFGRGADAAHHHAPDQAEGRGRDDYRSDLLALSKRETVTSVEEAAEVFVPAAAPQRVEVASHACRNGVVFAEHESEEAVAEAGGPFCFRLVEAAGGFDVSLRREGFRVTVWVGGRG